MTLSGREVHSVRIIGRTPDGGDLTLVVDPTGRILLGRDQGTSEVQTVRATNNNSTTRATALTPTLGKRVRVISINIDFAGATSNGLEVYFGPGTNIGTTPGKEITEAHQAVIGPVYELWIDGSGPVGAPDDVVSIRGAAAVAENVNLILVYREED